MVGLRVVWRGLVKTTEEELLFRDLFEDETQRNVVIESLKADCEVRTGRPAGL
jgi:hypothetical protein